MKNKYRDSDLLCPLCGGHEDDQANMLVYKEINSRLNTDEIAIRKVEYKDIFEDERKQKAATGLFKNLRKDQDPSTPSVVLETRLYVQPCIENLSSGN